MRYAWAMVLLAGICFARNVIAGEGEVEEIAVEGQQVQVEEDGVAGPPQADGESAWAAIEQRIGAILAMPRDEGIDVGTWRDRVEDALLAMGPGAAGSMRLAAERRHGYELSALQVALFRMDHAPLRDAKPPRDLVREWSRRNYGAEAKVTHLAFLCEMFPHHLFYMVEPRGTGRAQDHPRTVVTIAGDGRIDAIGEETAMARFMRLELVPAQTEAGRERVAQAAALLALARDVTIYRVEWVGDELIPEGAAATVQAEGRKVRAEVGFDETGKVVRVQTALLGKAPVATAPARAMSIPTLVPPPPPPGD